MFYDLCDSWCLGVFVARKNCYSQELQIIHKSLWTQRVYTFILINKLKICLNIFIYNQPF